MTDPYIHFLAVWATYFIITYAIASAISLYFALPSRYKDAIGKIVAVSIAAASIFIILPNALGGVQQAALVMPQEELLQTEITLGVIIISLLFLMWVITRFPKVEEKKP